MKLFFLNAPVKKIKGETIGHTPVQLHEALDYTSEGSEFLDDAIRTKDQPLVYAEETLEGGGEENSI